MYLFRTSMEHCLSSTVPSHLQTNAMHKIGLKLKLFKMTFTAFAAGIFSYQSNCEKKEDLTRCSAIETNAAEAHAVVLVSYPKMIRYKRRKYSNQYSLLVVSRCL